MCAEKETRSENLDKEREQRKGDRVECKQGQHAHVLAPYVAARCRKTEGQLQLPEGGYRQKGKGKGFGAGMENKSRRKEREMKKTDERTD
jgi:hypothetical protein